MLRCRQMEKDASLKYYQNQLLQLKKARKKLTEQPDKLKDEITNQELERIAIELIYIKKRMAKSEAEIQHNDYQIEIEEENLAREAAMAKERVMAVRAQKLSKIN